MAEQHQKNQINDMSKVFLGIIILLLTSVNGRAQSIRDKGYLSLQVGPSFPMGGYANKNVTDPSSGVAVTGETIKLNYTSLVSRQWGLTASVQGQRNPLDTKSFETAFAGTGYSSWTFDKASWQLGSLLIGGYGQFSASTAGALSFTSKAMVGITLATSPKLKGNSTSATATAHAEQSSKSAVGLSYLLGGGVWYNLARRVCLLSDVEYFGMPSITFKTIETTFAAVHYQNGSPTSFEQSTNTVDGKQRFSALNVTVGVGLRL